MLKTKSSDHISIIQITDTHIYGDSESEFSGYNTEQSLQQVLDLAQGSDVWPPDLMIVTGDIAQDPVYDSYKKFYNMVNDLNIPVFCLPGNHDEPELIEQYLNSENLSSEKQIDFANWAILLLNSYKPNTHSGELTADELDWLNSSLQEIDDKHILLAIHHHSVSIDSSWMDSMILINRDEFLSLIQNYPNVKAVICGHIHQDFYKDLNGVHFIGSPSTCAQFKPGVSSYETDDLTPGFRYFKLFTNGSIETSIYRLPTTTNS